MEVFYVLSEYAALVFFDRPIWLIKLEVRSMKFLTKCDLAIPLESFTLSICAIHIHIRSRALSKDFKNGGSANGKSKFVML